MSHTDYSAIRYSRHVIIWSYLLVVILVTMNLPIKAKSLSINTGGNLATVRGGAQCVCCIYTSCSQMTPPCDATRTLVNAFMPTLRNRYVITI